MRTRKSREKAFTIYGKPFGKQRPKVNKRVGIIYTPPNTRKYEKEVRDAWIQRYGDFRYGDDEAIGIEVKALFGIPKSYTKKRVAEIFNQVLKPTKKPDGDNILKVVLDGLNGVAFADDKQVTSMSIDKRFTSDGIDRVEVTLYIDSDEVELYGDF